MTDWGCAHAVGHGAGELLGTRRCASYGHPRCREKATCVHGLGHCERPDDMRGSRSEPGCGASSRGIRGSLADRRGEVKKKFCCVTTRWCNFWALNGLRRELRLLAVRSLSMCVASFDGGVLATFGLPPCRLPATNLPQAFGILTVALVPTPRPVLAATAFAQAGSQARSARSGLMAAFSLNVAGAHGRYLLPRESSERVRQHSLRALSKHE